MGKNALQIIEDVTKKYNIPVVYNSQRDTSQQSAGYGEYSSS
jgi:hypothetical protein